MGLVPISRSNSTGWGVAIFGLLILGAFGGLDPCNEASEANSLEDDPFNPSTNSYDWINPQTLPGISNCADGSDNDGDGKTDFEDYDCFQLADSDGNGVCDTRVYGAGGVESTSDQFFQNFLDCSGFEGCISKAVQEDWATAQGYVKTL